MNDLELYISPRLLTLDAGTRDLVRSLLAACKSPHTRRSYRKAITDLDIFADGRPLSRLLVLDWRREMAKTLSTGTVNARITAARKLFEEARRTNVIDSATAADLLDVDGMTYRGVRTGNWLDADQATALLKVPDRNTLRGKRNYCILAILLGCGLRRYELAEMTVDKIQMREDRWIFSDLQGKGGRVRTVAIPTWVKDAIAAWMFPAGIRGGRLIRALTMDEAGLSDYAIWEVVRDAAKAIGVANFGPHDLRRTCAKICRARGGALEQIQILLGHASIQTTERYLGSTQELRVAVNDSLSF